MPQVSEKKENTDIEFLLELEELIKSRQKELPENSYTTELFKGGKNKITKKLGEELVELVMASSENDKEQVVYESADFLYHLLVFLRQNEVGLKDIVAELSRR
jgi:phosphoribosyl-ATP pyrophosphohydrolase